MNMATKKDIFETHLEEYIKANRAQKGEILTHVCFVTGLHRKAVTRKFGRLRKKWPTSPGKRGRPTIYGPDVTVALRTVWEAGGSVSTYPTWRGVTNARLAGEAWRVSPRGSTFTELELTLPCFIVLRENIYIII